MDAANRTGKELRNGIEGVVRDGFRRLSVVWATVAGGLGILCVAVTFSLGATLGLHHQPPSAGFLEALADGSSAADWQRLIETNPTFPATMRACNPGSTNYSVHGGQEYCSFRMSWAPASQKSDWFSSALLAPSYKLGRFTPVALLSVGLALGLSTFLACFAIRKVRAG